MAFTLAFDPLREAFERFREHEAHVRRIVEKIVRDPEQTDDVIQEAYVVALAHASSVLDSRGWFVRVAKNLALLARRKASRRTRNEQAAARRDPVAPVDETIADAEARLRVFRALRRLPALDRNLLSMRYAQKINFLDIGTLIGTSAEAARSRVRRALDALREAIGETYESTTPRPWWRTDLLPGFESPDPRAFA